jgi:hypothetical protein
VDKNKKTQERNTNLWVPLFSDEKVVPWCNTGCNSTVCDIFIEWDGTTFYFPVSSKMVNGSYWSVPNRRKIDQLFLIVKKSIKRHRYFCTYELGLKT